MTAGNSKWLMRILGVDSGMRAVQQVKAMLLSLRRAILMDFEHGVDTGRVRAQQLREIFLLSPWMMTANLANACIVMLAGRGDTPGLVLIWGATVCSLSLKALHGWYQARNRPQRKSASGRAVFRAIQHAAFLGALWGLLPIIVLPNGGVVEQVLATNLIAGMSAGGAFALASIPAAAFAYLALMLVPALIAIGAGYIPASSALLALGVIYLLTLCATIFARYREFSLRVRDNHRLEQQRLTISVLLKDFETSASDWLWETDCEGRLSYVSDRFAQVAGLNREQLLGQSIAVTGGRARDAHAWSQFVNKLDAGEAIRDFVVPASQASGQSWWSLSAGPVIGVDGKRSGFRGVGTDISARKKAEVALEERNAILATFNAELETKVARRTEDATMAEAAATEANRAKSIFLANMSHEIRSPMNGVFGMTDLLMRTELSDRQLRLVSSISQSAKNLLTVINDILDISRIEAGKLEVDRSEFDLRHCVEGAVDLFAEAAQRKALDFAFFVSDDTPAMIWGDKGRLRQIFVNLIGNAIKFTDRGEVSVHVAARETGIGRVTIDFAVKDTGIGIDPADLAKLFVPFVQADSSISRRFGGTGLGLSISRHLVELMGGQMRVQSTPGAGTEITFQLTLDVGDASQSTWVKPRIIAPNTRMLIVDDRETNREILLHYLTSAGVEAVAVASAKSALQVLNDAVDSGTPFAVAIVDFVMPEMNGMELLNAVSAEPQFAGLKTILLTSMNWAGDAAEVREAGGYALLTKPLRQAELISTVTAAVAGKSPAKDKREANELRRRTPSIAIKARILVAEDNPVNVEVASELLTSFGCEVSIAKDGAQALAQFKAGQFDIILMDCQMPVMDGPAATKLIRAYELEHGLSGIPIIAVTAHAYDEDRRQCFEAGMVDYLTKPYSERELIDVLGKWVKPDNFSHTEVSYAAADAGEPGQVGTATLRTDWEAVTPAQVEKLNAVLDRVKFTEFAGQFDSDMVPDLVDIFVKDCAVSLVKLQKISQARDAVSLQRLAHKLAGGASTICASSLAHVARATMHQAKTEPDAALADLGRLHDAVQTTMESLQALSSSLAVATYLDTSTDVDGVTTARTAIAR